MVCVAQLVGPSGSGKTSSIIAIARILKSMGFKVAVLKHTHHSIDVPGKDSWRFVEEGGVDYAIVFKGGGERVAIFTRDKSLESIIEEVSRVVDVILVEGFKNLDLGYKIELNGVTTEDVVSKTLSHILECLKQEKPRNPIPHE